MTMPSDTGGVEYAIPSLTLSVLMGVTTTVHHLHAGLLLHPDGAALHVVWNEMVIVPLTVVSMLVFLRTGSVLALRTYLTIAALGFLFLGLYEGGWNHTVKVIAYLRLDGPHADIATILPPDDPHLWFYEASGVLTLVVTLAATRYTWRFWQCARARPPGAVGDGRAGDERAR